MDRRSRDPIFRFGVGNGVGIARSNFSGPAFQFSIRFLILCPFAGRNAKNPKKLDRPCVRRGAIHFFMVFCVSSSKRTQNQKSDRKLERRARKIGSRDFGKLDHGISTSILGPERKIGSRDWSQHQLTNLCSHCRSWVGPCAPRISELEPLTHV